MRKYSDYKIVLNEKRARKLVARLTMKRAEIYDENLATIELNRSIVTMNKPREFNFNIDKQSLSLPKKCLHSFFRYVGQAILDISKLVMYNFHYKFIKKNYPETELLFTDTGECFLNI